MLSLWTLFSRGLARGGSPSSLSSLWAIGVLWPKKWPKGPVGLKVAAHPVLLAVVRRDPGGEIVSAGWRMCYGVSMSVLNRDDFALDEYFWTATVSLDPWRGYRSCRGAYGSQDAVAESDGTVTVVFAPEGRDESPLKDGEIELVRWALQHASEMQDSLLAALLKEYPGLREKYAGFVEPKDMPPVGTIREFRTLIGLHGLNVHPLERDGLPYVGFELGCTWDDEHGLGVLMHGTRVVQIGGADTAILLWIAEGDAKAKS